MKVLYGYKPYQNPRKGVFRISTDEYKLPEGWVTRNDEVVIIGETNDSFVQEIRDYEEGKWVGNKVVRRKYLLPIGIHKSRLVKWITGQLELFDK